MSTGDALLLCSGPAGGRDAYGTSKFVTLVLGYYTGRPKCIVDEEIG